MDETTYTLPSGPQWAQALIQLAGRAADYERSGIATDEELARRINDLHIAMIERPREERHP